MGVAENTLFDANIHFTLGNLKLVNSLLDYRPQRSCEGYVFTPVCHSVHRGGLSQSLLGYHPPRKEAPPQKASTPREGSTPPGKEAHPPEGSTPPEGNTHPREMAATADGTHPTGMHSCSNMFRGLI